MRAARSFDGNGYSELSEQQRNLVPSYGKYRLFRGYASRQAQVLAEGMTEENFAVSPGQERIAWQDGEDLYDSRSVHIMDLETGKSAQIKAPEGSSIRLLGFVGGDLVYGLAEENSSVKVNGRTVQAPNV